MLQITNIRQGAVLNHNHGVEDENGLTVLFEGISDYPGTRPGRLLPGV